MCWETFTEEAVFPNIAQIQILRQRHWEGRMKQTRVTETKNEILMYVQENIRLQQTKACEIRRIFSKRVNVPLLEYGKPETNRFCACSICNLWELDRDYP